MKYLIILFTISTMFSCVSARYKKAEIDCQKANQTYSLLKMARLYNSKDSSEYIKKFAKGCFQCGLMKQFGIKYKGK